MGVREKVTTGLKQQSLTSMAQYSPEVTSLTGKQQLCLSLVLARLTHV